MEKLIIMLPWYIGQTDRYKVVTGGPAVFGWLNVPSYYFRNLQTNYPINACTSQTYLQRFSSSSKNYLRNRVYLPEFGPLERIIFFGASIDNQPSNMVSLLLLTPITCYFARTMIANAYW